MSYKSIKLAAPILEAKDRTSAKDLLHFITYEEKMRSYLNAYGLLDITCGYEEAPYVPEFDEPTRRSRSKRTQTP
jgi:hypothetical protein